MISASLAEDGHRRHPAAAAQQRLAVLDPQNIIRGGEQFCQILVRGGEDRLYGSVFRKVSSQRHFARFGERVSLPEIFGQRDPVGFWFLAEDPRRGHQRFYLPAFASEADCVHHAQPVQDRHAAGGKILSASRREDRGHLDHQIGPR